MKPFEPGQRVRRVSEGRRIPRGALGTVVAAFKPDGKARMNHQSGVSLIKEPFYSIEWDDYGITPPRHGHPVILLHSDLQPIDDEERKALEQVTTLLKRIGSTHEA